MNPELSEVQNQNGANVGTENCLNEGVSINFSIQFWLGT